MNFELSEFVTLLSTHNITAIEEFKLMAQPLINANFPTIENIFMARYVKPEPSSFTFSPSYEDLSIIYSYPNTSLLGSNLAKVGMLDRQTVLSLQQSKKPFLSPPLSLSEEGAKNISGFILSKTIHLEKMQKQQVANNSSFGVVGIVFNPSDFWSV